MSAAPARRSLWTRLLTPTPRRPSDILRSTVGAGLGVAAVGMLAKLLTHETNAPLLLAPPVASSAVLVFAIPASPLAQPRAVIGGNVLSALVGVACGMLIPHGAVAGPAAVGLSICAMLLLGCLHPPAAAVAFVAALAPAELGWSYAVTPIALGSALLCLAGALYAPLVGRVYPHPPPADLPPPEPEAAPPERLTAAATCGEAMSPGLWFATPQMDAEHALAVLTGHDLRTAPVLDAQRRVLGLVRRAELVLEMEREMTEGAGAGRTVGELLDRGIHTIGPEAPLGEAVPWLAAGAEEVVVVDKAGAALGVITQADALGALWRGRT
jgi:CBS domain-containing membrane protein